MERTGEPGIRIGVLCEGSSFQRWQAEALRSAMALQGVDLCVMVVKTPLSTPGSVPAPTRRKRHWGTALYRRYRQRSLYSDAMAMEDLGTILQGIPRLAVSPTFQDGRECFGSEDLKALRSFNVDVLLRFGFNILDGDILALPRYGIWSFHHGDPSKFRGGPPGLWEIMNGDPVTGAVLQRLTDRLDAGMILRQGWFKTVDHSLKETVDTVLMHSAVWPSQVLRSILQGDREAAIGEPCNKTGPIHRYPGNFEFLRFLWKQASNKLAFHRRELKVHEDWNVGILYEPIATLVEKDIGQNVRWLPPPSANNFRADPFGYTGSDGQLNLLYEKYDHGTQRGEISRIRPKKDNVLKRSRSMLQLDAHLSYPFVVQQQDTVFVVPEQAGTGRVDLYRVSDDNDSLERVGTVLEEALYDPTLFEHEGRWWLMGTKAPLTNVALYAYHSERLEGPYVAHAQNPIKMDIRSARPAGTPFQHEGSLYRPGQDSSMTYGGRIALNRILLLTPGAFREEIVRFVGPVKGSEWDKGLHTLCGMGDITLIDGKRWTTVPERRKAVAQRKMEKLKQRKQR